MSYKLYLDTRQIQSKIYYLCKLVYFWHILCDDMVLKCLGIIFLGFPHLEHVFKIWIWVSLDFSNQFLAIFRWAFRTRFKFQNTTHVSKPRFRFCKIRWHFGWDKVEVLKRASWFRNPVPTPISRGSETQLNPFLILSSEEL